MHIGRGKRWRKFSLEKGESMCSPCPRIDVKYFLILALITWIRTGLTITVTENGRVIGSARARLTTPPSFFFSLPPSYERELLTCTIRGHLSDHRLFFHVHSSRRRMNIHRLDRYPKEIWTGFDSGSIYLLFISLHEYYYSSRIDLYRFVTVRNFRPINPLHLPRPNKSTVDVSLMKKKPSLFPFTRGLTLSTCRPQSPPRSIIYLILQAVSRAEKAFFSFLFFSLVSCSGRRGRSINGVKFSREIGRSLRSGEFYYSLSPSLPPFFSFDRVKNATRIKRDRAMIRERWPNSMLGEAWMMEERPITGPYAKIIPKFGYDDSLWSFLFFPPSSRWTRDAIPVIYSGNLVWRIAHPTPSSFSLLSLRGWSIRIYLEGWFSRRQSFPFLTDRSFVRILSHPGDTGGYRLRLVACTPCCTRFQAAVLPKDGIKGERSMTRILSRVWRIVKLRNFFSLCLCQLFCIEDKRYKDPFLFFPFL